MKREILFRGKRTDNGEWLYGAFSPDVREIEGYGKHIGGEKLFLDGFIRRYNKETHHMETIEVYRDTVGQFTGMTDKNGKRIFEDDIMIYVDPDEGVDENEVIIVRKPEWTTAFMGETIHKGESIGFSCIDDSYCGYMEVIGNIHDNKELLEVKS